MALTEKATVEIVTHDNTFDVVADIIKRNDEMEETFMVADLGDMVCKYKLWKLKMPRVKPFYAVKCNDSLIVLRLLAALGVGFDCASKVEIEQVLSIGVAPGRIIFANPCKPRGFIKAAAHFGVKRMTFDNEFELHKVKAFYADAELVIRIRVDDSGSGARLGDKFGCDVKDTRHLLEVAKELDLGVIGVSFHVGSRCRDPGAYSSAIACCRCVFDIAAEIGFRMTLLDIGGGFPGFKDHSILFEEISNAVAGALKEHFPLQDGIELIAEPGRYFVASAFTLCTNIIGRSEIVSGDLSRSCKYYISDGLHGSFNCIKFDPGKIKPIPVVDPTHRPVLKSSLWGPTCNREDCVLSCCYLPFMSIGEWLMFENMGAYTTSAASTFNGFPTPIIRCILPINVMKYLNSLPTWKDLLKSFGEEDLKLPITDLDMERATNKTI